MKSGPCELLLSTTWTVALGKNNRKPPSFIIITIVQVMFVYIRLAAMALIVMEIVMIT